MTISEPPPGVAEIPQPPTGLRRLTAPLRFARRLAALPAPVARFHATARFTALRLRDDAPQGALRPDDLATLLRVARGRRQVVELGTSKAWTAISLALADPARRVTTYDPAVQPIRDRYLSLAPPSARARITFVAAPGEAGPEPGAAPADLLFIDSGHDRDSTIRQFEVWRPTLASGALIVFDDCRHPDFPGVAAAVRELGLTGETHGLLFIHRPLDQPPS